jgi:hypothetical protein
MIRHAVAFGAVASLAVAPLTAQVSAGDITRTAAPQGDANEMGGGIGAALLIVALAGAGMLFLLLTDDDDETPVSP